MTKASILYVLQHQETGHYLVGSTNDWGRCHREHQLGIKTRAIHVVRVNDAKQIEKFLYRRFELCSTSDSQWLNLDDDGLSFLRSTLLKARDDYREPPCGESNASFPEEQLESVKLAHRSFTNKDLIFTSQSFHSFFLSRRHWTLIILSIFVFLLVNITWKLRNNIFPFVSNVLVQGMFTKPQVSSYQLPLKSDTTDLQTGDRNLLGLTSDNPNDIELEDLITEYWAAKSDVLSGKTKNVNLLSVVRPIVVERLDEEARRLRLAGVSLQTTLRLKSLRIIDRSPLRIAAQVELLYSDKTIDKNGILLSETPPTVLKNTYVFARDNGRWRIVAFRPSSSQPNGH
jgi:hypothetical protein